MTEMTGTQVVELYIKDSQEPDNIKAYALGHMDEYLEKFNKETTPMLDAQVSNVVDKVKKDTANHTLNIGSIAVLLVAKDIANICDRRLVAHSIETLINELNLRDIATYYLEYAKSEVNSHGHKS